ncbi:hypothetical protein ACFU7Y_09185 [Kitasatospora sp. NPDC057542]
MDDRGLVGAGDLWQVEDAVGDPDPGLGLDGALAGPDQVLVVPRGST